MDGSARNTKMSVLDFLLSLPFDSPCVAIKIVFYSVLFIYILVGYLEGLGRQNRSVSQLDIRQLCIASAVEFKQTLANLNVL
jgi:hypothetical protein